MWRAVLQWRAGRCLLSALQRADTSSLKQPPKLPLVVQSRAFSKPPSDGPLPEPPPLSTDDLEFMGELASCEARSRSKDVDKDVLDGLADADDSSELPEAPNDSSKLPEAPNVTPDWEVEIEVDESEEVEDVDPVPYFPPIKKLSMVTDGGDSFSGIDYRPPVSEVTKPQNDSQALEINPELERVLAAWGRAVLPSGNDGPMPLHELANRSTKIKELLKLGVDLYKIAGRHGDLEKLMLLDWESQVKPQIRHLVDIGIHPDRLGDFFTRNTALLWTDQNDILVRLNYLEAKGFSEEQIKKIINGGAFWLTLSTKEIDGRLSFIQKTFELQGNEVRSVATSYPSVVSGSKWPMLVDTTKLLEREFGFNRWERKQLLMTAPQCYLRPSLLRQAFDFCHTQIGLTHSQLVLHAQLLVTRVNKMKPRYEFLKLLKRDIFNAEDPLYVSPDCLWRGSVEEFCEKAAKTSVEHFNNYIRYSDHS